MSSTSRRFEVISTSIMVVAALAIVLMQASIIRGGGSTEMPPALETMNDWRDRSSNGIWVGSADAEFVFIEFMDFTCPFCARLAPVLDSLVTKYPERVALVYQHFPLGKPLSEPAAIAGECAAEQDRFREMSNVMFSYSGSLSSDAWSIYADSAGVEDLDVFAECIAKPVEDFPRIAGGRTIGLENQVSGTPTLYVNGVLTNARTMAEFETLIAEGPPR